MSLLKQSHDLNALTNQSLKSDSVESGDNADYSQGNLILYHQKNSLHNDRKKCIHCVTLSSLHWCTEPHLGYQKNEIISTYL